MPELRSWSMFATPENDRGLMSHIGSRPYAQRYATMLDLPCVPVLVTENPSGLYYGWLEKDEDAPEMIQRSRAAFETQFEYTLEIEMSGGRGAVIRLDIAVD